MISNKEGLAVPQAASPLSFPEVMFFLMHRCCNLLWAYYPVVDADIVNQAGEVGSRFHSLACTDV